MSEGGSKIQNLSLRSKRTPPYSKVYFNYSPPKDAPPEQTLSRNFVFIDFLIKGLDISRCFLLSNSEEIYFTSWKRKAKTTTTIKIIIVEKNYKFRFLLLFDV